MRPGFVAPALYVNAEFAKISLKEIYAIWGMCRLRTTDRLVSCDP